MAMSTLEDLSEPVFGVPAGLFSSIRSSALLAIVFFADLLKAPFAFTWGVGNLLVGGTQKAVAGIQRKDQRQAMKYISGSFQRRFLQTLNLLIHLKIETPQSLHEQFQKGNIDRYMTLAILVTAFASRCDGSGKICLATGMRFSKKDCPGKGLALFDLILKLKDHLVLAGAPVDHNTERASLFCHRWFPAIAEALVNLRNSATVLQPNIIETDNMGSKEIRTIIKILSDVQTEIAQIDPDLESLKKMPVQIARQIHA
jgi:hypothetical protein